MWMKLGTVLVREGVITPEQLDDVLRVQMARGGRLGAILVERGYLDADVLGVWLGRVSGFPVATSEMLMGASADVLALIPATMAERFECIPFQIEERSLKVAMVNPTDPAAIDALSSKTLLRIEPYVIPESLLSTFLEKSYRQSRPPPRRTVPPEKREATIPPRREVTLPPRREATIPPRSILSIAPMIRPSSGRPTRPPPLTIDRATATLATAQTRDEVVDILLSLLPRATSTRPCCFTIVRRGMAIGWKGLGEGMGVAGRRDDHAPAQRPIDLSGSGREAAACRKRPPSRAPSTKAFSSGLRRTPPASAVVVPIVLRSRVINLLYADRLGRFDAMDSVAALTDLALQASGAYGRILKDQHKSE